jgi:hypothetical protein
MVVPTASLRRHHLTRLLAAGGECPGRGVGQDVEYVVEMSEVLSGEGVGGAGPCLAILSGDGLAGGHDPGHPGEDADEVSGVPRGAVW